MVGVRAKRGISLVMITMVFLLKTISSSANTAAAAAAAALYNKSNNNDTACCVIADDLESEFLMDSEIRRMLVGAQISPGTLVKDKSSADCGRGKTYTSCLPLKNGVQPPDDHCDDPYNTHNRECRPRPT